MEALLSLQLHAVSSAGLRAGPFSGRSEPGGLLWTHHGGHMDCGIAPVSVFEAMGWRSVGVFRLGGFPGWPCHGSDRPESVHASLHRGAVLGAAGADLLGAPQSFGRGAGRSVLSACLPRQGDLRTPTAPVPG